MYGIKDPYGGYGMFDSDSESSEYQSEDVDLSAYKVLLHAHLPCFILIIFSFLRLILRSMRRSLCGKEILRALRLMGLLTRPTSRSSVAVESTAPFTKPPDDRSSVRYFFSFIKKTLALMSD